MARIVYNIPVNQVAAYRGQKLIVRSEDPAALVGALAGDDLENLVAVQLLSLTADTELLATWGESIPVELVMLRPQIEFPILYRHARLLDKHPMRVSIAVVPGFSSAVRVAASLQFVVKLEPGQPAADTVDEMRAILDFYLHNSMVCQPIEFFHSTLMAIFDHEVYDRRGATLWDIQEEDPAYIRYVTEDGRETLARWPYAECSGGELASFVEEFKRELLEERAECLKCEHMENCGGYFKWPRRDFSCEGVKSVFLSIKQAAAELRGDLDVYLKLRAGASR